MAEDVVQGSQEWRDLRTGRVTASRFAAVMTEGRGGPSKTVDRYILDICGEILSSTPADTASVSAMDWGHAHEDDARSLYALITGRQVELSGFVVHPEYERVGASPDSLVGDDGGLEIKCPKVPAIHLGPVLLNQMPKEHVAQVQGNMWVTGRKWWDFVSYHPLMPPGLEILICRVERDEDFIERLEMKIDSFLRELDKRLERFHKIAANNLLDRNVTPERMRQMITGMADGEMEESEGEDDEWLDISGAGYIE